MDNKRKPVPAGGQPTPATIANADSTPSANAAADSAAAASAAAAPEATGGDNVASDNGDAEFFDARVLVAFGDYSVDDIVSASETAIQQLYLDGRVDPHVDAVTYARSLQA